METIAEDTGSGLLLPDDADFHLRDPNFSNHLVKSLQTLRECEHFCDVKLVAGTRSIHAHRAVLAAASPYFRALLGPNMAEGYMQNIEIQDIDPYALAAIVNYIYSSELTVKGCKVEQILKTADFLDLQTLCLACCQFLCKHLNSENCLDMYFIADHYGCDELRDRSLHLLSDCLRSDPNQSLELYDMAYRTGHHELQRKALETVPLLLKSNPDACVPLYKKGPEHPEMMALALEYLPCYLEAHIEDYLELYHGAISQHQDELRDKILEYLPMYLASDPNQCIPLYLEACQDGQSDLQAKTMEFMLTEFWRITQTDSFMLLPPDVFLNILKNEKLSFVPPGVIPTPGNQELGLLKIILDFIHHKPDDCKQYLHQYLKFMKLPTLPKSALCDMMQDPMIPSDCIDILNAAQARKQVMADSTKKRMPKTVQRQSTVMRTCVSEQRRDRLAGDNPDTPVCFTDKDIAGPGGYVTKLDIWLRPWQGDVVIAGIRATYSNGQTCCHGDCGEPLECEEIHMQDGEVITWIAVRANSVLTSLKFYTSLSNSYGPYGGERGRLDIFKHPALDPMHGYLSYLKGSVVELDEGVNAIRSLDFVWLYADLNCSESHGMATGR